MIATQHAARGLFDRHVAAMFVLATFAACGGCGGPYESHVGGKVSIDDAPLTTGTLTFQPIAGGAITASTIESDGRYEVKTGGSRGLAAGEYAVTAQAFSSIPGPNMTDAQLAEISLIPLRYRDKATSGIRVTVEPGANDIPIELVSGESTGTVK